MKIWIALLLFSHSAFAATAPTLTPETLLKKPRLVLVLVVDQFRADYLTRFASRFLPAHGKGGEVGGYRYLMSQGAYFPFAQYDVLQCMTGPGHAMILSGSYPYQMGIPMNAWFDRAQQQPMYCVQDAESPVVGAASKLGFSPRNFRGDTVGDELKNAGYPSRVVGLALKDRAAILLGGKRADLALWFDGASMHWVSSRYYLPNGVLPEWTRKLNQELEPKKGLPYVWESHAKGTGLSLPGPGFRHESQIGTRDSLASPLGIELTEMAAERVADSMKLGKGTAPDLLAISFSSHDYVGHQYGPNTLEMEEMTLSEDRVISKLLNHLRRTLPGGLSEVQIAFTADHGIPPSPSWLATQKMEAGTINGELAIRKMDSKLNAQFGKPDGDTWFEFQADLNFTFRRKALEDKKVSLEQAEAVAKPVLAGIPGVAYVFSGRDVRERTLPPGMFERKILKTYVEGRSGDLIAIPRPFYQVEDDPVTHMTGYAYDRTVPLVLVGPKLKRGVYSTQADVVDLAPTLSFLLGILPPAASEGRVLSEAIAP